MTREELARRAGELAGGTGGQAYPVAGGDICEAHRVRPDPGPGTGADPAGDPPREVFAKTLDDPPPEFFAAEAAGLRMLRETGTVAVPAVLARQRDLLVLEWVTPGSPTAAQAERLGRELAALHETPAPSWGTPGRRCYLGTLELPSPPEPVHGDWPGFHARYRLLPLLRSAVDKGALGAADVRAVERLCQDIGTVAGPPQPPAVIHGDLWSGNLLWAADGRPRLIDPAAQGGHPETDLALLELFGAPQLPRILAAYEEVRPLPGRAERVPLHQLVHLLAHAVLFGGGYGAQCGAAARAATD